MTTEIDLHTVVEYEVWVGVASQVNVHVEVGL